MALIRNIVKSILPPEDTAEMWLDGEGKLRAYTIDAKSERIGSCFDILTGEQIKFVGY